MTIKTLCFLSQDIFNLEPSINTYLFTLSGYSEMPFQYELKKINRFFVKMHFERCCMKSIGCGPQIIPEIK